VASPFLFAGFWSPLDLEGVHQSLLGDPLYTFLIPEEHGNWFAVVHDPVGVRGTLLASSGAEEAGFQRLSIKEASGRAKVPELSCGGAATMLEDNQEVWELVRRLLISCRL
jgi:hypothetical protein